MSDQEKQQDPQQDLPQVPALPYTIRANLKMYRKRLGVLPVVIAIVLLGIIVLRLGLSGGGLLAGAVIALIVGTLLMLGRRTLTIANDGLTLKVPLIGTRKVSFDQIDDMKIFVNYVEGTFGAFPRVSIAIKQGKPFIFSSLYWPLEELDKLLAVINEKNIDAQYYPDPANFSMIAKQFPSHATLIERHPQAFAWYMVLGIVVVVFAGVLIFKGF